MIRKTVHLCGILPPKHHTKSNHEKNHQTQIERNSTNYLTNTCRNCQGHQNTRKAHKTITDQRRQSRLTLLPGDPRKSFYANDKKKQIITDTLS